MKNEIKNVGIIGSGVMGHGIALTFARYGYQVTMNDISQEFLDNAMGAIRAGKYGLDSLIQKSKITKEEAEAVISRINTTTDLHDLKDCNLIVEAVPEDRDMKGKIFNELDKICHEDTIFASNTSGIMISDLSSFTSRGAKFIGMHWFNPPQIMKLVEIVKGPETSLETMDVIKSLSLTMEKVPVIVNDSPGFFTTRFINSWLMEAYRIFEEGIAGIYEIDQMSKLAFGFPMGPFELSDLIGLDTILHISEYMFDEMKNPAYAPPTLLKKLVLSGYTGDKKGSKGGFYKFFGINAEK